MQSLFIVGAGRLGERVGKLWPASVVAETKTGRATPHLRALGFRTRLRAEPCMETFSHVLFCIPPSGASPSYEAEAVRALGLWNKEGAFVMISSTAVYAEDHGGEVQESSALADSARAMVLLRAEQAVLHAGGSVLRLAGLYDETSGPHWSYFQQSTSPSLGSGWLNLIHREDAASLAAKALNASGAQVYLGVDLLPITRQAVNELSCKKWNRHPCQFLGTDPSQGKRCHGEKTRRLLQWHPRYESFPEFLKSF